MRLILKVYPLNHVPSTKINKHTIQGMLYSHLKGSKYENLHTKRGFKFFTFSDFFPANDFYPHKEKKIIIASPNADLINTWYHSFKKEKYLYISDEVFKIADVRISKTKFSNIFETGSPIVIYKNNRKNEYFSFRRYNDLEFFLNRLKDNALKKFNTYYNDEYSLEGKIFDTLIFKKEVAINIKKDRNNFLVIGSVWKILKKSIIEKEDWKFYNFISDVGLGEKNSLGFGLVNPKRVR